MTNAIMTKTAQIRWYKLTALLAVTVLMASAAMAQRTVNIVAYDDATREVSLAFGGTSGVAENVYLAYGPVDCGGHFRKWPSRVNIGTIATGAAAMTYTLPAEITTGVYYRFFVGDSPYDAELEYIQGDGKSWINTQFVPSSANRVETKVYLDDKGNGTSRYETFYCARSEDMTSSFTGIMTNGNLRIDRKDSLGQQSNILPVPTLTCYTLSIDYSKSSGAVTTNLLAASDLIADSADAYTAGGKLTLFTSHKHAYTVPDNMESAFPFKGRMYWFKLTNTVTGNLDLDIIPVIVGGSPCMYDRVSGNVLPRKGKAGGAFIAGRELSAAVASSQTCRFGTLSAEVNYSTGDVTLSFPQLDADADVWAVYSTDADAGAFSPNGWGHYAKVANVSAGATSATFYMNELAGVNDAYTYKTMRFVLAHATEKNTPFDYQAEYIVADGTTANMKYIDTGIVPSSTDSVAAGLNIRAKNNGGIWSARKLYNSQTFSCLATIGGAFRFDRNTAYSAVSGTFTLNSDYELAADYKTRIFGVKGAINGATSELIENGGNFTPGSKLYLFAMNNNGNMTNPANCWLYWLRLCLWSGEARRDLIPVVKDGTAYLYDKVTDTLMANHGTFTVGPRTAQRYGMDAFMTSAPCFDPRDPNAPAYAQMVAAGAGSYSWRFYNSERQEIANPPVSMPDATMAVILGSSAEVAAVAADRAANGWTAGGYRIFSFTVMSDGETIAGFDGLAFHEATIDLAGHSFILPAAMRDSGLAFTVTNSIAATVGTLTIDVPSGAVVSNDFISLRGNLTLVKTGAGGFVAAKSGQTYTGGTAISNGVFAVGTNGDAGIIGPSGTVTVGEGATLDMCGKMNFGAFDFVLAGGTLASSALYAYSFHDNEGYAGHVGIASLTLTANSTVSIPAKCRYGVCNGRSRTAIDLGGHTLTFDLGDTSNDSAYFDIISADVENGTMVVNGYNGYSAIIPRYSVVATNNVTWRNSGRFLPIGGTTRIDLLNYDSHDTKETNEGNDGLHVWGVFTPHSTTYRGLTMEDGSTLDLSAMEVALPSVSPECSSFPLKFAENATVCVKVGERSLSKGAQLVSWTTPPENIGTVTFKRAVGERNFHVESRDDGLYYQPSGFMIIVK